MQLKPIAVITILLLVVASLLAAGCTTSNTPTATPSAAATATATPTVTASPSVAATATPTVTASPSASALSASEFNVRYAKLDPNDTISTPFTKTMNARGHAVYSGMVKFVYSSDNRKVSFELCTSQSDAQQTFQKIVASANQQGYSFIGDYSNGMGWVGSKPKPNTSEEVYTFITGINEPASPFSTEMGIGYNIETIEGTAPP